MDPDLGLVVGQRRDQLTFDAFCETHEQSWFATAQVWRLSEERARAVVDALRHWLWGEWQMLLREPEPMAEAWRVLKVEIARAVAAVEAGGHVCEPQERWFRTAAERMRLTVRAGQDDRRIYEAVLSLPERQQDVVVLQYVLDLPEQTVAAYLGSTTGTVRSTARRARDRLESKLAAAAPDAHGRTGESGHQWREIDAEAEAVRQDLRAGEDVSPVCAAILSLPESQQDVVVLRFLLGLSEQEVADHLGSTVAEVRSRDRRASGRLRRMLGITSPDAGRGMGRGMGKPEDQRHRAIRTAGEQARAMMRLGEGPRGIYRAILSLPERQQEVTVLCYLLGLPETVVAAYLGSTVSTVRSNARHARNGLKEKLGRGDA
ncbi:hypothetical protein Kpho02_32920 [Kitasatospora phosalacinea]|uniref:RNA polymerase sigma factor 70 region 4 type 2 domain-containing protein n=1 Tax=Kitasatospora phosalacinea TaxID=2065 RepID=A0A9W6Q9K1_9ACTN|nr:sigma factor-like helix-turn-helix DNA-binding protein [Kitasatospora phosalacinea]GLW70993.1 hypothetical protein Kpho02_32920 [Kitasatospora phosalacinea]